MKRLSPVIRVVPFRDAAGPVNETQTRVFPLAGVLTFVAMVSIGCALSPPEEPVTRNDHGRPRPSCYRTYGDDGDDVNKRIPIPEPQLALGMSAEWHEPESLGTPVNTKCLEDAIQISPCGQQLYFMYTEDLLSELGGAMLSFPNGTYVATRTGGPAEFSHPTFYELGLGVDLSLDGKPIFTPDGSQVYFHSNRADNLGNSPEYTDYLDMYVAPLIDGVPGVARNLGPPVNSVYPDGEAELHPDGVTLYFASLRPGPEPKEYQGGPGKGNLWRSTWNGSAWSDPEFLPFPINRPASEQKQPAFVTHDGTLYMYFVSDHLVAFYTGLGWIRDSAIYRSTVSESGDLGVPELVIRGIVGEPSLTADGRYLYFVHVLYGAAGGFGSDIWYVRRKQE